MQEGEFERGQTVRNKLHQSLPRLNEATQGGDVRSRWGWAEPSVWTPRMLMALERGVKGGVWALAQRFLQRTWGACASHRPMSRPLSPLWGESLTGEPCAGDPHARFGGGGSRATGSPYPYRLTHKSQRRTKNHKERRMNAKGPRPGNANLPRQLQNPDRDWYRAFQWAFFRHNWRLRRPQCEKDLHYGILRPLSWYSSSMSDDAVRVLGCL